MFAQIPTPGRLIPQVFLGFAIPMTLSILLGMFLEWWSRTLPTSPAPFMVVGLPLILGLGFYALTYRMRTGPRIAVAVGYFPMICVVLVFEALFIGALSGADF